MDLELTDQFSEAAHEYETLWAHEGSQITAAMETASGLKFEDKLVKAMVLESFERFRIQRKTDAPSRGVTRPTRRKQR